jgi:hypothetical protein
MLKISLGKILFSDLNYLVQTTEREQEKLSKQKYLVQFDD